MYELTLLEDMINGVETYRDYCEHNDIDEIKKCPVCNTSIATNFIGDIDIGDNRYLINVCPSCEEIFIVKYEFKDELGYIFSSIYPKESINKEFEKEINLVSTKFSKIYNQALKAEAYNLEEIAGMGYRKSLEYLIKDYIIHKNPDKELEVKKMMLGKCISDLVENPKIKSMAKGATWLGNDETHYIRKWENKDIEDLKKLIDLTVYWIVFEMKTEEYKKVMEL